jgi:thioredoxin
LHGTRDDVELVQRVVLALLRHETNGVGAAVTVITSRKDEQALLADAFADTSHIAVIALCAAWCDTCNEFRSAYERLAESHPHASFVWLDIEDDADVAGDIDVENFPTLAIFRGTQLLHFGVSLPHPASIGRLIDALAAHGRPLADPPETVVQLPRRLLGNRA